MNIILKAISDWLKSRNANLPEDYTSTHPSAPPHKPRTTSAFIPSETLFDLAYSINPHESKFVDCGGYPEDSYTDESYGYCAGQKKLERIRHGLFHLTKEQTWSLHNILKELDVEIEYFEYEHPYNYDPRKNMLNDMLEHFLSFGADHEDMKKIVESYKDFNDSIYIKEKLPTVNKARWGMKPVIHQ